MSYDRLRRITELREQERLLSQARLVVQQRLIQARMELGSYLKDQILFSYFYSTLRLFVKEGEGQHMQTQQKQHTAKYLQRYMQQNRSQCRWNQSLKTKQNEQTDNKQNSGTWETRWKRQRSKHIQANHLHSIHHTHTHTENKLIHHFHAYSHLNKHHSYLDKIKYM